jgi:glutamate synthase (NADPH/NADH) small chain
LGKKIVVFGAGNVAFDCARSALRLGAEKVSIIYRRTKTEMPARHEEIHNAEEEGIEFELLVTPKEILADANGRIRAVRCSRNELGMPDAGGRRRPIEIPDSDFEIEADLAVVAVGTVANPLLISVMPDVALTSKGFIKTDESFRSSCEDIFAGGDIVSGAATVILAIQQGKKAAVGIDAFLQSASIDSRPVE